MNGERDEDPDLESRWVTDSGLPVRAVYGPDGPKLDPDRDLGVPGAFPFTRGIHPDMYRGRL
jgi:methylmalonyl-CoA mutase, N-terminal domain